MTSRIPILLALLAAPWLGVSAQGAGAAKEEDRMPFAFGSAKALYDQNIHPRVLLGPEDVVRLKARTREGDGRVILDALREKLAPTVDKVMAWEEAPETITVEQWTKVGAPAFGALLDIVMVGVLDEDARFLAAATRVFAAVPAADAIIRKNARTGMSLPLTHGWAYDLLWHHLTPDVRQAYCRWAVETAVREPIARGSQGYYGSAGGNIKLTGMSNPLATILAIQGDEGVPDLSAELRDSLLRFEATLHVVINPDGYPEEDIGYGTIVAGRMAQLVEVTRRAGLYDAYRRCPRFAKFGRSMLHFVQPWGLFLSNTGDHGDDFGLREFVLARLATETNDPTLLWLLGTLTYPPSGHEPHARNREQHREVFLSEALPNVPVSAFSLLALDDLAAAPAHPAERDIPTQYRDRRRGIVTFRSGWEDDATFVVFDGAQRSPAAQGHAHDSAGHFSLSALGEYFAIDTGRYNIEQSCHNVTLVNGQSGRSTDGEWRMSYYYGRLTDYRPDDFVDYAAVDSSHQHNCYWAWRHLGLVKGAHSYVWTVDDINEANKLGEYWWQLHTSPENEITLQEDHAVIKGWRHGNLLDVHFALLAPHEYPTPHSLALAQDIAGPSSYKYIPNPAARARQAVRPSDQIHHAGFQRPRLLAKVTGYNGRFMSLMLPRAKDDAPAAVERLPSIDASLAVKITFPDVEDIIIFAFDHQLLQAADIVGRGQWCVVRRSRATGEVLAWQLADGTELAVGGRQLDITQGKHP